jgi:hypothetical protein
MREKGMTVKSIVWLPPHFQSRVQKIAIAEPIFIPTDCEL